MKLSCPVAVVAFLLAFGGATYAQSMRRITNPNTPAHQASIKFMRGINVGNYLEYAPSNPARNVSYSSSDFRLIREEGFDHVRIPIAWHLHAGPSPNYTLSNSIFEQADALVNEALGRGLAVIINLHHFDDLMRDPPGNTQKFYAIWRQVGEHYASFPQSLAFELLNEPNGSLGTAPLNSLYAQVIRQVRASNPNRTLFVGPANFNSIEELQTNPGQGLQLPNEDENLIVTVHSYDPYYFTHQGAEWALPDTATIGVLFPGPPPMPLTPDRRVKNSWVLDWFSRYNRMPERFNPSSPVSIRGPLGRARDWSDFYGRPVHVGEFGCYTRADRQSRVNYYRVAREAMDEFGLGWAMWDWKSGFHYIRDGRPDPPGLREAMFPSTTLQIFSKGTIEFEAAKGKTFAIEKAASLAPPVAWTRVTTETLTAPRLIFKDPKADAENGAFYRVQWLK